VSLLPPRAAEGRLALTEPELLAWGRVLGMQITPPLTITIRGELGAGKTTLVRAICEGYGVREEVTSPTFALVHTYESPRSVVHHADLYRLKSPAELRNIGWDEILVADAVILVEWPERAGEYLPDDHLPIELSHVDNDPTKRVLYAGGHHGHRTGVR
jgi:tRNA threonylcarbamoyl adenosine modification protein YjeE